MQTNWKRYFFFSRLTCCLKLSKQLACASLNAEFVLIGSKWRQSIQIRFFRSLFHWSVGLSQAMSVQLQRSRYASVYALVTG